jgi:hypothetical protein
MFLRHIGTHGGHHRDGRQKCRGFYVALFTNSELNSGRHPPLRACVRKVYLSQLGHFMVGNLRIGRHYICVSGSIGHDGLPLDTRTPAYFKRGEPPHEIIVDWDSLVELPVELRNTYWQNKGHNTVDGEAAAALNAWATENLKALRGAGRIRK